MQVHYMSHQPFPRNDAAAALYLWRMRRRYAAGACLVTSAAASIVRVFLSQLKPMVNDKIYTEPTCSLIIISLHPPLSSCRALNASLTTHNKYLCG